MDSSNKRSRSHQENTTIASANKKSRSHQENTTLASSSSSPSLNGNHHLFVSFHGPDVRVGPLSHIREKFISKGISTFVDNDIERGMSIGPELTGAIRGSRIALVWLSKNYASSTWCLNELVEIIRCRDEGQIVMTLFYKVDPSDVKKQTGDFGKVFRETCKGKTEYIQKWKHALEEVAQIAGYYSEKWNNEAEMFSKIATDVSKKLNISSPSRDFDHLVGMESHMTKMGPLLRLDAEEVRMIGIWGPPGIGKTTLARYLFNRHSGDFQLSLFMDNIKTKYGNPARSDDHSVKLYLQQQFLSQLFKEKGLEISRLSTVQDRLKDKKVLVVLDDVDQFVQLEAMAKKTCWFGPGSRIIITTQDRKLLKASGVNHIYKVGLPSTDEALEMFCMYAFDQKYPEAGFLVLACEVTRLVGELPLGLKIMGSYFRGLSKSEQEWEMALRGLMIGLDGAIENILMFSYVALHDEAKKLFLHIACFFKGESVEVVEGCLADSFPDVTLGLHVLAEKSLIEIEKDRDYLQDSGRIVMHDLLSQLGREIVRKQSVSEPGKRRKFLNDAKDIEEVLGDDKADTSSVIGICLRLRNDSSSEEDIMCTSERVLERFSNLRFLRIHRKRYEYVINLWSLNNISQKLSFLSWPSFEMPCLPSSFHPTFLVKLEMPYSVLKKLWDGVQPLRKLKEMDLSFSRRLKEIPDLSTAINLYKLDLSYCINLVEIPSSIGNAVNLQYLDFSDCLSLVKLPSSIGNAINLKKVNLSGCSSLMEFPSSIGNAVHLQHLDLSDCSSLVELPSSIGNAVNIKKVNLSGCSSLMKLPSSIENAVNLEYLDLSNCSSLVELPSSIGAVNLQHLNLRGCSSLVELPSSIGNAVNLKKVNLSGCSSLMEFPSSIGNAVHLQHLDLSDCSSLVELPSSIGNTVNIKKVNLSGCSSLMKLPSSIENAVNLEYLDLSNCSSLVELPSSIGAVNLQHLNLRGCSSLVELPSSIGNAVNLQHLDLRGCSSLVELPSSIGNAVNLKKLNLSGCSSLLELPSSIGNAVNLKYLDLSNCSSLVELPSSIGNTVNLQHLDLGRCSSLLELPSSIRNAVNLEYLDLSDCSSLVELSSSIGNAVNLQHLDLTGCSRLVELPSSIGNTINLQHLDLIGCSSLVELPSSIGNAVNLQYLDLSDCSSLVKLPSSIGNAVNLQHLNLSGCLSLLELPSSIGNAVNLKKLNICFCWRLVKLPSSIGNAVNLQYLDLSDCSSLVELPSSIGNVVHLQHLDLSGCSSLMELPSFIGNAVNLQHIDLRGCSNLVELPSSMRNLCRLTKLELEKCSKLEVNLANINLESIEELDLTDCSLLKSYPETCTSIQDYHKLNGAAIKKAPSGMSNCEIQELGPWIGRMSRLRRLILIGMKKMVSLPQLPYSLLELDAVNCESLERLDCSFRNQDIRRLNFANCFKLNQEARDLIIQTHTRNCAVLPEGEVPVCFPYLSSVCFPYRSSESSVTVKLNQMPLGTSPKFKACIVFAYDKDKDNFNQWEGVCVYYSITSKQNDLRKFHKYLGSVLENHVYIFEVEAVEVASTKIVFEFRLNKKILIKECGVLQLLEVPSC